jgi:DnaJ-class molecular chaperone
MVKDTELYDRLELTPSASDSEIKKAFLRLSKIWHPDKQPEQNKEEATKKFQAIQEAKEVLSDPEKKRIYDQVGMDMFNQNGGQQGHPFAGFGGFPFPGMGFPGMPGMPGMRREKQVEPVVEHLRVSLEDVYNKREVPLHYSYLESCSVCDGQGAKIGMSNVCNDCKGQGRQVRIVQMGNVIQQHVGDCPPCRGTGKIITDKNKCESCQATGTTRIKKTRHIKLPPGAQTGHQMNMQGKGHHLKHGRSDLIIVFHVEPHTVFKRHGDDLITVVEIPLYQALCGFDKKLTHLDGRVLRLHYEGKTESHTVRCIPLEGMQKMEHASKGSLYILFKIRLPDLPPTAVQEWKKALQRLDKEDVKREEAITKNDDAIFSPLTDVAEPNPWIIALYNPTVHDQPENEPHHEHEQAGGQPQCVHQ